VIIKVKRFHVYNYQKFWRIMPVINTTYQSDTAKVGQYGIGGIRVKSGIFQKGDAVQTVVGFGKEFAGAKVIQNIVFFDVGNIHNAYVLKV
jgi:hypothetical protein